MPDHEPLHVLIIEDDADTRANLTDILELDNHHVETAGSQAEALARKDWSEISMILLDRELPDGHAQQLLPKLMRQAPGAEILIVTGYRDLEGALACLRAGASDYILKPINPEALRANLARLSEKRRMAQQLRLLATAVRDVNEGILITGVERPWPAAEIVFVNEALTQITGYSERELIGQTPEIFQSPRTDRTVLDRLRDRLLEGQPFTGEMVHRRKDGAEYDVELHVSPVFDPAGRVTNYVSTQRDITARKRAEERILQAQRLAAIGQMVTGLAHESRNALQRSKACLEMLAFEVEDRPEALDLVARVNKAQDHLHHLYEEVRSYAAPLTLKRESIDLAEVWRDCWTHLDVMRGGKNVVLREEISSVSAHIQADAFALGQVFRNIFENAIVACPEPGEVWVHLRSKRLDRRAALEVSIRDNGPGLNAEQAQRIFDPFFTTKTKGTGLGMAIAKRIVDAHGGHISVGNNGSGGAEILITLPVSDHEDSPPNRRRG
jgi:PAS domain S-box-containing protein